MEKKKRVNIYIDERVLERVDKAAKRLEISRSQMIENFCAVGLMDYDLLTKTGLLSLLKKASDFRLNLFADKKAVSKLV